MIDRQLLADLAVFARHETDTADLAPAHDLLRHLTADLDSDAQVWACALHMAHYAVPSGWAAFTEQPECTWFVVPERWHAWPIGQNRRHHRPWPEYEAHLHSWQALGVRFLREGLSADLCVAWRQVFDRLMLVHGNGRWAAYTMAETLLRAYDWRMEAPDLGNENSSGPRRGIACFFGPVENGPDTVRILDDQALAIRAALVEQEGLWLPLDALESVLCDFQMLLDGRYYVGRDIERLTLQVRQVEQLGAAEQAVAQLDEAMRACFKPEYLVHVGIEKPRLRLYRDTGAIVAR